MQNVIIGTAGHIDHGKTSLIRALTGRETDTLKEEIKRGISINLGFTYFDLPNGKRAGIIDVPGHERFIKTMIAGATGVDLVLIVVAANEGIMPQTIEHIEILSFLELKEAVFVLTKCSIADEIMQELVIDEIKDLQSKNKDAFYANANIICVDSISKLGIDKLINEIARLSQNIKKKNEISPPRLSIDRVFTLKGFGTVVTGTLIEGAIKVSDELEIFPKGLKAKIRSVHVHEQSVETAYAGQRTALNISNLKVSQIERGDVLAQCESIFETEFIDAKITIKPSATFEIGWLTRVRVYIGAKETLARVTPLDARDIKAGESGFCQLRLEEKTVCKKGDKFVLRNYSPMETIGGGVVIDPNASKHKKSEGQNVSETLQVMETGTLAEIISEYIKGEVLPVSIKKVTDYVAKDAKEVFENLQQLLSTDEIIEVANAFIHMEIVEIIRTTVVEILSNYHEQNSFKKGMPKDELKQKLIIQLKPKEFDAILELFLNEKICKVVDGTFVCIYGYSILYNEEQLAIKHEIENGILNAKFSPPSISEVCKNGNAKYVEILESCVPQTLIRLDSQTCIHIEAYEQAKEILFEHFKQNDTITLADFRDALNTTRKYAVLLLDHFDKTRLTLRVGDFRKLAKTT